MKLHFTLCAFALFALPQEPVQCVEDLRTSADRPADVQHIKLEIDVFLSEKRIAATATIDLVALRPLSSVALDAVGLEIASVRETMRSTPLRFENAGDKLQIDFSKPLEKGEAFQLAIQYQVRNPKAGLYFFAPSPGEPEVPLMCWTQGEAVANRHWFPCFDHPNELQTTELIATVDAGFEVVSNGRLVSRQAVANGQKERFHWKQSEPHVAYLVTMVVGKFAIGKDAWRGIPVLFYAPPDRAADIAGTFGRTVEMIDYFSRRFGVDYPWEKYAQVVVEQFVAGGMENTSATTLIASTMHDRRALLDSSPDGLIAHELGHQWWGDLLTCKDWAHLWLNEGFATYCEVLWDEHKRGRDERDFALYQKSAGARSGACLDRPIVDRFYRHPDDMFDGRAYPKGAWVLHMMRSKLGDEEFFAGLNRYARDHRHQSVESADLRRAFERQTGCSFERFFYQWTERPGHPVLEISCDYESDAKAARVQVKQAQAQDPFWFPLKIEFRRSGQPAPAPIVFEREIRQRESTFFVPLASRPEMIRVDPDFTLLAEIRETKSRELWSRQLTEGPTVPERLRAVDYFAGGRSAADVELLAACLNRDPFHGVKSAAASALGKIGGETARKALIDALALTDPKARNAAAVALGNFAGDETAAAALEKRFLAGDASYFVEASCIDSLSRILSTIPDAVIDQALSRSSHRDVIRTAAIRAIGKSNEATAVKRLVEWSARGKPVDCRIAAIRALPIPLANANRTGAEVADAIRLLSGYIQGEGPRIRRAAVESLRDLGRLSQPAESILASLADQDPDQRIREFAAAALEKIRAQTPPPVEISRLRQELEKLQKKNREQEERLQRLERR